MPAENGPPPSTTAPNPSLVAPSKPHGTPAWLSGIYAAICLYLFVAAINVMGSGLKLMGGQVRELMDKADNPVIALMVGVIITAIVQSSSFTTSLIITLVATQQMDLETAIFAIMGANIGTSITNNLVSLGTVRIRRQFRRAYTAALMHGNVNLLTVAMLFPLEWATKVWSADNQGVLTRFSVWFAQLLDLDAADDKPTSFVKIISKPIVKASEWVGELLTSNDKTAGAVVAIIGVLLLFTALVFLVKNLKGALLQWVEGLFSSALFKNDLFAGVVGAISTFMVQSSSVTTSLMIPLAGAGAVKLERVFPFMLGCNLGTTVTGVIAATAVLGTDAVTAAVAVAVCHVTFNVIGATVWYIFRAVPIGLARWYAKLAAESKRYYALYILVVYIVIPGIVLMLSKLLS